MTVLRFLDACARRPVDATPVWLMRQAGRYLPEYRAIREKLSFIEMCKRPDVACEVTLQPLRRFELDAAIVFADILLPLEPMGIGFHFAPEDGPVIEQPIRSGRDVKGVRAIDPRAELDYVMETLRLVRREIDGKTPLIGFAGAPYTLASYVVEGGHTKDYARVKTMMFDGPGDLHALDGAARRSGRRLPAGTDRGRRAGRAALRFVGRLDRPLRLRALRAAARALHRRSGTRPRRPGDLLRQRGVGHARLVGQVGADVYGVDWRIDLDRAWEQLGDDVAVQGNLDPLALLGPTAAIEARVADVLRRAGGRAGHVFNLGHGLVPQIDPENVRYLVDVVHRLSADAHD